MTTRPVTIRLPGMDVVQDMDDAMLASILDTIFNKKVLGIYHEPSKRQMWIQCSNVLTVEYDADSAQEFRKAMGG